MVKPDNRVDKERFEDLKSAETKRGLDEQEAIKTAAEEVKELRREEGRAKQDGDPAPS
jgi:hypothetical protein